MTPRIGVLTSHPIQYQAPLFRELAKHVDLKVYFAHRQTAQGQATAGFNVAFEWDVDLLGGFDHRFLHNRAKHPDVSRFFGCDTPEIDDEIRQGGFDAFLVTGWYLKSYWQAIHACRRYGVPVMVRGDSQLGTPRGWLKQFGKDVVYPQMLRKFDACLYVGQKNLEYLKRYGVATEKLFFSPHCVDNEWFRGKAQEVDCAAIRARFGIGATDKAVLFVGKFIEVKRPLDIVEALHLLRQRDIPAHGVFTGDGLLREAMQSQAKELDVPVSFLGFRNQSEMPEVYAASDVLVLPSESETWGLTVNEALACGKPAVASDAVGCVPDMVIEGQTGATYPMGDSFALADALQRVLVSPPQQESVRKVSDAHSLNNAVAGILDAMNWLTQGRAAFGHGRQLTK